MRRLPASIQPEEQLLRREQRDAEKDRNHQDHRQRPGVGTEVLLPRARLQGRERQDLLRRVVEGEERGGEITVPRIAPAIARERLFRSAAKGPQARRRHSHLALPRAPASGNPDAMAADQRRDE